MLKVVVEGEEGREGGKEGEEEEEGEGDGGGGRRGGGGGGGGGGGEEIHKVCASKQAGKQSVPVLRSIKMSRLSSDGRKPGDGQGQLFILRRLTMVERNGIRPCIHAFRSIE
ncbi:hypothetical protein HZH68_011699 [Vespula germanica]|uniref:Uncharacterized protein n=1 Tax=Vespula germanica TaxID=30212 RepID=A0A834JKT8_VESGE|nr:hypothetical protein HZH68_011699 [Vespula germanica]